MGLKRKIHQRITMRRKNQCILNGALVGVGTTLVADILLQRHQLNKVGLEFTWENFDGKRTFKRCLIGGAVGGVLGYGYYCLKISEEEKISFNSDNYIKKLLTQEHLKASPEDFKKIMIKRQHVKQWLLNIFSNKLVAPPEDAGSFSKRTAIASTLDLDIVLPLGKYSYYTLEAMFNDVYNKIGRGFEGYALITKQTKAIGVTFSNNGNPIHFDIVPGREINNYKQDRELNLYVNPEWAWQRGSSFKTNTKLQKDITRNRPEARSVIKLLKVYKNKNGLSLPALTIEQCVTDGLSNKNFGIHNSITENLLNSMNFLSRKLNQKGLMDIANTNNNLHDKIDAMQRSNISNLLKNDIKRIEEDPRYIKEIFEC